MVAGDPTLLLVSIVVTGAAPVRLLRATDCVFYDLAGSHFGSQFMQVRTAHGCVGCRLFAALSAKCIV